MARMTRLTPVGIAILALLVREPMHPYEMRHRIRTQEIDRIMKVTHGTLYSTVERLATDGLIEPVEVNREGKRPERTVYRVTEAGQDRLIDALRDGLMRTTDEYPRLVTMLAFASLLSPEEVVDLLGRRRIVLEAELSADNAALDATRKQGLSRVHIIEVEYMIALLRAEIDWVAAMVDDIRTGRLTWEETDASR
jgi:DNA-binding PadR family transcriptional regulator